MSKWTQAQMKKIDDASAAALGKIKQQQNAQGSSLNERWNIARGKDDRWERSAASRAEDQDPASSEHDAAAAPFTVRARAAQLGSAASPAASKGPPPPPPARLGAASSSAAAVPPPPPARQPSADMVAPSSAAAPPAPPPRGVGALSHAPAAAAPRLGSSSATAGVTVAPAGLAAGQAMIPKFSEMDATEKAHFFSLLDEYFQSRGFFQQQ
ncbi:hypothetical protein OC834_005494 [Tilletia horrida]|uniref:Uncharacterized protein n=1 Tax=Tilletia horrida TaxID=155126 RepID=A0AAN6JU97_9BASI|nr:hypothetical protein OC834_005494 [Tilletia horrida]KAK0536630.1 hypothetical protein OC835_001980 [Tilletia horrida]KAK0540814.1 hypothetical protein OC842_000267 [Tilletia horrida]KAK0567592.1 hypothetical protein OC844_000175 [Tilletia horrida]